MTGVETVPNRAGARVTIKARVVHLCPHVEEADIGTVDIAWTTNGATIELHSLARHLRSYVAQQISHEDLTVDLAATLDQPGIADVTVTCRFHTAGFVVEVSRALPRDPLHVEGA